jgi:hypothetical protein
MMVIFICYVDESHNAPLHMLTSDIPTSKMIDDNKECYVDIHHDNGLDDGPVLLNDPSCTTIIINSCEDRDNDNILVARNDALIHESPILFLNSPNHVHHRGEICLC